MDGQSGDAPPAQPVAARLPLTRSASDDGGITLATVVRFLLGVGAVAAGAWLLWYFAALVVYLVIGGIFAYLLRPLVDRFQGLGLQRVAAILVTFALVFSIAGVLVTSLVPFLAQQIRELSQLISAETATDAATFVENRLRQNLPLEEGVIVENVQEGVKALMEGDLVEGDRVAQTVSSVVSVVTNIVYATIIIPFITFFLLKDGVQLRRQLLHLVPNRYFEVTLSILEKVEANIGRYFRALLIQCTAIAVIASFLLTTAGLQSALAIGIFTGLANTIPYFGPFLGFLGGALVGIAQTGSFALVPGVAIAMLLTQAADNVLLQPVIFSRAAQAHPLVILFVVLVGAQLAGIVGMLIAIPLATTVRVVAEQVFWSIRNYRILRTG
jgi:predicted PurR-regulated permease PerM